MKFVKNYPKKWTYWLTLGIVLIIIYKILDSFSYVSGAIGAFFKIISPMIIGAVIAYFLFTPCKKFEDLYKKSKSKFIKTKARTLSILTVYVIGIIILALIITFIIPAIIESSIDFISNIQTYFEKAVEKYGELPDDNFLKSDMVSNIIDNIRNIDLRQYINVNQQSISQYAKGAIDFFNGMINIFVAFIVSVYVLSERTKVFNFINKSAKALLKENKYNYLEKYFTRANKIFLSFISNQVIDGILVGILSTIALLIMGIKYAPLLGFIIGLFNIIPYVGIVIGIVIVGVITLITGGIPQTIGMIVVVNIIQQIEANVINKKMVEKTLKVSPLLVMIAITIGGAYWGLFGIFVAVPVSAIIKIVAEDYVDYKTILKQRKERENQTTIVQQND